MRDAGPGSASGLKCRGWSEAVAVVAPGDVDEVCGCVHG